MIEHMVTIEWFLYTTPKGLKEGYGYNLHRGVYSNNRKMTEDLSEL
jgi:hypothetical protein